MLGMVGEERNFMKTIRVRLEQKNGMGHILRGEELDTKELLKELR